MIKVLAEAIHHTIEYGDFDIYVVTDDDIVEHIVLIRGDISLKEDVLCRVSSECLPGTALFSAECDCKQQIEYSLKRISEENEGIFLYLRQEGRGHGLSTKIKALANKNKGMNTFEAIEHLGLPADIREYSMVKQILDYFKVRSIRFIGNSVEKLDLLEKEGIIVSDVINIPIIPTKYSYQHLCAKKERGHNISFL